ncbi:uncharacterized protein LOC129591827 [Paramacrobiotus metropolitanus]|uniref:uncharacterized protein LOC129591827 n=1 Tax=Paramacrobiotus metropolitanus TaxID=2943436 RepID=UPI002445F340|nr:uncharacterized protein LOC129591827 [Paramacrobiotus metropolitanus]XP_055343630.1 uncharacterized protein LOC129591827 [Paramacrobiotus metropolitanus]
MSATPRFYREVWTGARETNYANTVLVRRDGGQWWLGYVQDVRGKELLVDFDASTVQPQWIHTSLIWPHHSRYYTLDTYVNTVVQVALRERPGGPLVFRPARVVAQWRSVFLAVCLDEQKPQDCFFVHGSLFAEALPVPGDGQSFFARTDGLTYTKHVIPFPAAGQLRHVDHLPEFVGRACQFRLGSGERLFRNPPLLRVEGGGTPFYAVPAFRGLIGGVFRGVEVVVRLFVRAGTDSVTFVCLEMHNAAVGRRMSWNEEVLKEVCQSFLQEHSVENIAVVPQQLEGGASGGGSKGAEEASIKELAIPILTCILTGVDADAHTQLRFSRVCGLWNEVVRTYGQRVVILDSAQMWPQRACTHQFSFEIYPRFFRLFTAVDHAVTANTAALLLLGDRDELLDDQWGLIDLKQKMKMVRSVLHTKGIHLSLIVVRNKAVVPADPGDRFLAINIPYQAEYGIDVADDEYTLRAVSYMMSVCDALVFVNYKASRSILRSARNRMYIRTDENFIPASLYTDWKEDSPIDVGVTIPLIRFHCDEAATEQRRRFLAAANDNCPAVRQHVREKIAGLFARWADTVPDDGRAGMRKFLQLFNSLGAGDDGRQWETLDMRRLDVGLLNNLTFAALNGCYLDDGEVEEVEEDNE